MSIDKMVMTIIEREEANRVLEALITAGHTPTIFGDSRGGVLRQARPTLFVGVEADKLDNVLSIIRENCRSHVALESTEGDEIAVGRVPTRSFAEVGSAVVFVWDIDRFETY
ncbi:MAG: cyclic-di-AMP receptor [Anaerolineae bacterium]